MSAYSSQSTHRPRLRIDFGSPLPWLLICFVLAGLVALVTVAVGPRAQIRGAAPPVVWRPPQSGWLFVLDPRGLRDGSQILLVNPVARRVEGILPTNADPDMALSPDGTRLFLATGTPAEGVLVTIDTATGQEVRRAEARFRWGNTSLPSSTKMAMAPDGRRLYVYQMRSRTRRVGDDRFMVATFDTATGSFLPQAAEVSNCGAAVLLPSSQSGRVHIVCAQTNDIVFLEVADDGAAAAISRLAIPRLGEDRLDENGTALELWRFSGAVRSSIGETLYVVTQNGRVVVVDANAQRIVQTVDLRQPGSRWFPHRRIANSPDGRRLYVGHGRVADRVRRIDDLAQLMADRILVVDTTTWRRLDTIRTRQPFWNLVVSPNGARLYALNPEAQTLDVIDAATGRRQSLISNVGETPAIALVAP